MRRLFWVALAIFPLITCSSVTGGKEKSLTQDVVVLESGVYGKWPEEGPAVRLVTDQQAYTATFGESHKSVDFEKFSVVFVILEQKMTAGWSLNFKEASLAKDQLKLTLTVGSPAPGLITAQVLTRPFLILRVPKIPFSSVVAQTPDGQAIASWSKD